MAHTVPFSSFDTQGFEADHARTFWLENINVMFDVRLARADDENFHASVGGFLLGELFLSRCRSSSQAFERSRYRTARDGLSQFLIQFYDGGSCGPRDAGRLEWTRPGDLLVVDLAQPLATAATDFSNLNLLVPRRLLAPLLRAPDRQHLRIVRREAPFVSLLERHLARLYRDGPRMAPSQALTLVEPTLDLVAAALNGGRDTARVGLRMAQKNEIWSWLQVQLGDARITPDLVAERFGISRRKLYYLFEEEGGIHAYVQACRLQAVRAALADHAQAGRTIGEIAGRHGFHNRSAFIGAFRRLYGLTPGELRAMARDGSAERSSPLHAPLRGWVSDLR